MKIMSQREQKCINRSLGLYSVNIFSVFIGSRRRSHNLLRRVENERQKTTENDRKQNNN